MLIASEKEDVGGGGKASKFRALNIWSLSRQLQRTGASRVPCIQQSTPSKRTSSGYMVGPLGGSFSPWPRSAFLTFGKDTHREGDQLWAVKMTQRHLETEGPHTGHPRTTVFQPGHARQCSYNELHAVESQLLSRLVKAATLTPWPEALHSPTCTLWKSYSTFQGLPCALSHRSIP